MIVATSEHLRAFGEALGRAGIDLAARRDAGTCMTVDAEDAMRELIVDGKPDRDRFDATVGEAIRAATADGRPLSVVGELVSLLWEAGMVEGVIELEELLDELGRELPLRTLCAYRLDAVSNSGRFARGCCAGGVPAPLRTYRSSLAVRSRIPARTRLDGAHALLPRRPELPASGTPLRDHHAAGARCGRSRG